MENRKFPIFMSIPEQMPGYEPIALLISDPVYLPTLLQQEQVPWVWLPQQPQRGRRPIGTLAPQPSKRKQREPAYIWTLILPSVMCNSPSSQFWTKQMSYPATQLNNSVKSNLYLLLITTISEADLVILVQVWKKRKKQCKVMCCSFPYNRCSIFNELLHNR